MREPAQTSETLNSVEQVPFVYRDFYDLPRMVIFTHDRRTYLLDCPFDHEADEYPTVFAVYELPYRLLQDLPGQGESWVQIPSSAVRRLGTVPVNSVSFDPSLRRTLSPAFLSKLSR